MMEILLQGICLLYFMSASIKLAYTVITILCFTSLISSGRAYTGAPIFRAILTAYLALERQSSPSSLAPVFMASMRSMIGSAVLLVLSWKCLICELLPPSVNLLFAQEMISLSTMGVPSSFSLERSERV